MERPRLDDWDDQVLGKLIRHPSQGPEGQLNKLKFIKTLLLRERDTARFPQEYKLHEVPVEDMKAKGQDLYNLVVQKGTNTPGAFTVFIPAHIDTVPGHGDWDTKHILTTDPKDHDKYRGLGVYDMQAAALNSIRLAREFQVPPGMNVLFGFTVDEEQKSRGAKAMLKWDRWKEVDLVLSSEIGPLDVPDDDERMRYIVARKGIIKVNGKINIEGVGGHAAQDDLPNAGDAFLEACTVLKHEFWNAHFDGPKMLPKLQKEHRLLGREKWDFWRARTDDPDGLVHPQWATFGFKIHLVPPSTLEEVLQGQRACMSRLAMRQSWARHHIDQVLMQSTTKMSYEPYEISEGDPLVVDIAAGLREYSGMDAVPAGAPSVADENLYAASGKKVVTIPYRGDGAHSPREWASKADIARVRGALQQVLGCTLRNRL